MALYILSADIYAMIVSPENRSMTRKECTMTFFLEFQRQVQKPVMVYSVPLRNLLKRSFRRLDCGKVRTRIKESNCHTGKKATEEEPAEVIVLCYKLWETPSLHI